MNPSGLPPTMNALAPRLLVSIRRSEETDRALDEKLGDVPRTYAAETPVERWMEVEAALVGSVARELGDRLAESAPKLAFVQGLYTGLDGLGLERIPAKVRVAGNVGAFAPFVAEHALALALASARGLLPAREKLRARTLRPAPEIRILRGGTALILGYGAIGRELAVRLDALGMRVVGLNRTGRMAPGCDAMFPASRLAEALGEADLVVDVRPLTRATERSIGRTELEAMRPHGLYVNVGRAGTIDEEALYAHLRDHPEFRAALDVWWDEDFVGGRIGMRFPFPELDNFVGSPHCAGLGPGTGAYVLDRALENLGRFFRGEEPDHLAVRSEYASVPSTPSGDDRS